MVSNFPAGSDNFTVPSSLGTTALSSAGTGSRNHVQHHRDLGDAIEAMQAEATLLVHSHNGSTARHGIKLLQANTHQTPDTDVAAGSLHHTLGHGTTQAAPGNHADLPAFADTHSGAVAWPVGSIFMTTVAGNPAGDLGGTWVQITDAFLIGVGGSYSYTGSVVANDTTHTHAIADTSSDGAHSHTLSGTVDTRAVHFHSSNSATGSTNPSHTHTSSSTSPGTHTGGTSGTGASISGLTTHTHTLPNSGGASHTHSAGGVSNNASGHSHTASGATSTASAHSHTVSASTVSHLPPYLAVYTWKRTA